MSDQDAPGLQGAHKLTFHRFAELPAELQLEIIKTAVEDQGSTPGRLPLLACVSSFWQKEVERVTFRTLNRMLPEDTDEMAGICVGARRNCIRDIRLCIEVPNAFLNPSGRQMSDTELAIKMSNPDAILTSFISDIMSEAMTNILNIFSDCKKEDRVGGHGLGFTLSVAHEGIFDKGGPSREARRDKPRRGLLLHWQNVVVQLKLDALQPVPILDSLNLASGLGRTATVAVAPWSLVSLLEKFPSLENLDFNVGPKSVIEKMRNGKVFTPVKRLSEVAPNLKKIASIAWDLADNAPCDVQVSSLQNGFSSSHSLTSLRLIRISNIATFFDVCVKTSREGGSPVWPVLKTLVIAGRSRYRGVHSEEEVEQICLQTVESFTAAIPTMPALREVILHPCPGNRHGGNNSPKLVLDLESRPTTIQGIYAAPQIKLEAWMPLEGRGIAELLPAIEKTHAVRPKVKWREWWNVTGIGGGWHAWDVTESDNEWTQWTDDPSEDDDTDSQSDIEDEETES